MKLNNISAFVDAQCSDLLPFSGLRWKLNSTHSREFVTPGSRFYNSPSNFGKSLKLILPYDDRFKNLVTQFCFISEFHSCESSHKSGSGSSWTYVVLTFNDAPSCYRMHDGTTYAVFWEAAGYPGKQMDKNLNEQCTYCTSQTTFSSVYYMCTTPNKVHISTTEFS